MSILGDWIARLIIDYSKVAPALSSSEKRWDDYYKFIEKRDKEQGERIKKSLEDVTSYRAKNTSEAKALVVALTKEEKKAVDSRVKDLARAEAAYNRQIKLVSDLRLKMLQYASVAITIPVTFLAKKAIEDFAAFQQAMQNIRAVIGATEDDMKLLTETAVGISEKFATSPTNIAKAMFELGQAGLEAKEIYNTIGPVLQLSAAGMKDVAFTANLVTTTLQAFQLESDQASNVADIFAASNAKSVSSLDKLSASLKYTAGLWSSMGWTLEDLVGSLDVLYDTGVRGEKAGRLLASAINGLQKPTRAASKAITDLLGFSGALSPAFNDITQIIEKLSNANADSGDIVKIFGKESAEVILRLVQNYDILGDKIAEVTGQTGEAARQASTQLQGLEKRFDTLKTVFGNISKETTGIFEPAMRDIVNSLIGLGHNIEKIPSGVKAFIVSFGLVGAASIPVVLAINSIAAAAAAASLSVGAFIATVGVALLPVVGFAAVAGGLVATYAQLRKNQEEWNTSVLNSVSKLSKEGKSIDFLTKSINSLYEINNKAPEITGMLEDLANVFPKLRDQLNKNAGDTAAAMRVLNNEYSKLKQAQAEIAKGSSAEGMNELQVKYKNLADEIMAMEAELSKLKAINPHMREMKEAFSSIGKGDFVKTTDDMVKNLSNGSISVKQLGNDFVAAGGLVVRTANKVEDLAIKIQGAKYNQLSLLKVMSTNGKSGISDNLNRDLATLERMVDIFDNIEGRVIATKFKLSIDNESSAKEASVIASAIADAIGESLSDVVVGDVIDMERLGILPKKGEITTYYQKEFVNMYDKVKGMMSEFGGDFWDNLKNSFAGGGERLDFTGSFQELEDNLSKIQGVQSKIAALESRGDAESIELIKEKSKLLNEMQEKYANLFTTEESLLTMEERGLRNAILLSGVLLKIGGEQKKQANESIDWWQQIINNITTSIGLLKGKDLEGKSIKNLNEVLKELRDSSGASFIQLRTLATEMQSFLSQNPEFQGEDEILSVEYLLERLKEKGIEVYSSLLKTMGIDLPVENFKMAESAASGFIEILEKMKSKTGESAEYYRILDKAIKDANESLLNLKGTSGAITDLEFKSSKFIVDLRKTEQEITDLQKAFDSFNTDNFEEAMYVINSIDPSKGLPEIVDSINDSDILGASRALKQLSAMEKKVIADIATLNLRFNSGVTSAANYNEELKKLEELLSKIRNKKDEAIIIKIDGIKNVVSEIEGAVSAFASLVDTFKDGEAQISDYISSISANISALGAVISALPGGSAIGGIMTIVGTVGSIVGEIFGMFEDDSGTEDTVDRFANTVADALNDAIDEMQDRYRSIGSSIGNYINNGIGSGLEMDQAETMRKFRLYLFNMISEALITASGFEDKIAEIAEKLWEGLSPGQVNATLIKSQLEDLYDSLGDLSIDRASELYDELLALVKPINVGGTNVAYYVWLKKIQDIYEELGVSGNDEAASLLEVINKIKELEEELANADLSVGTDLDQDALDDAGEAIEEYAALIQALADSLGLSSDQVEEAISGMADSIATSLAQAVLQGSFADFKKAMYNQIVSSIVGAVVDSALIKDRIASLISSIMSVGEDFTSEDANSILNEIRSIWAEVTDENTPLGSVMMGLRDALNEFGLLDINVNPGTVVTAIPSDVRDDLITAIEHSIDMLVEAITIAGLNSNINTVNITTAYITSMTSTTIAIQQANLNLNGSMVFQMQNGASFSEWLEAWMTDYLARSAP